MMLRLVTSNPEAPPSSETRCAIRRLGFAVGEIDREIAATGDPTRRADLRLLRGGIAWARELLQNWEGTA
jgi:hypothetical protein